MTRTIKPSIAELKQLERQCREECQQFIDEMVRVQNMAIRPMFTVPGSGKVEYGPYPPATQDYLDKLQAAMDDIVERYKRKAE